MHSLVLTFMCTFIQTDLSAFRCIRLSCWNIYYAFNEIFYFVLWLSKYEMHSFINFIVTYYHHYYVCAMIDILTFRSLGITLISFIVLICRSLPRPRSCDRVGPGDVCVCVQWEGVRNTQWNSRRVKQAISNVNMTWKIIKIFCDGRHRRGSIRIGPISAVVDWRQHKMDWFRIEWAARAARTHVCRPRTAGIWLPNDKHSHAPLIKELIGIFFF